MVVQEGVSAADKQEREPAGLGDNSLTEAASEPKPEKHAGGIRMDIPPKPLNGQRRAPCPKGDVEIRGGCWAKLETQAPDCQKYAYEWNGGCYVPVFPAPVPATSNP
jgi:hypothetical protein